MGVAYLDRQKKSGGIKLNDVIEDYKYVAAGKEIKVGDFVNYINGIVGEVNYGESADTTIDNVNTYTGWWISAVALDENRVFIAHSYSSGLKLYGMVCTLNGATITPGKDTVLQNSNGTAEGSSIGLLPDGRVFISHKDNSTYLYGMVCTINGDTINVDVDTKLSTQTTPEFRTCTVVLPSGNVFIAHSYGSSNYLYGMVCTINGTTITAGTDTALNTSKSQTGHAIAACLLPSGNVFIAHSYNTSYYLYGIVVSISGTTITKGSAKALNTSKTNTGQVISTCLLPNGNVFIAHSSSTNNNLYGIVCTVEGTTITAGTDTSISGTIHTADAISTFLLNGNVCIIHSYGGVYKINAIICTVDGTTITLGTDITINETEQVGYELEAVLLPNGTMFVAHSHTEGSYYLYAQIFGIDYENNIPTNNIVITEYEQQVTPAEDTPFDAIALSDGIGGTETAHNEQVLIARPNVEVV